MARPGTANVREGYVFRVAVALDGGDPRLDGDEKYNAAAAVHRAAPTIVTVLAYTVTILQPTRDTSANGVWLRRGYAWKSTACRTQTHTKREAKPRQRRKN